MALHAPAQDSAYQRLLSMVQLTVGNIAYSYVNTVFTYVMEKVIVVGQWFGVADMEKQMPVWLYPYPHPLVPCLVAGFVGFVLIEVVRQMVVETFKDAIKVGVKKLLHFIKWCILALFSKPVMGIAVSLLYCLHFHPHETAHAQDKLLVFSQQSRDTIQLIFASNGTLQDTIRHYQTTPTKQATETTTTTTEEPPTVAVQVQVKTTIAQEYEDGPSIYYQDNPY